MLILALNFLVFALFLGKLNIVLTHNHTLTLSFSALSFRRSNQARKKTLIYLFLFFVRQMAVRVFILLEKSFNFENSICFVRYFLGGLLFLSLSQLKKYYKSPKDIKILHIFGVVAMPFLSIGVCFLPYKLYHRNLRVRCTLQSFLFIWSFGHKFGPPVFYLFGPPDSV